MPAVSQLLTFILKGVPHLTWTRSTSDCVKKKILTENGKYLKEPYYSRFPNTLPSHNMVDF